jgi:hypothetical protein
MPSTNFTDKTTVIEASWLNEVNALRFDPTGSALVTYTPPGTGAVTRTVRSKLGEMVSVMDFGAVGDGVTDDTAAVRRAAAYLKTFAQTLSGYAANPMYLLFPPGHAYLLKGSIDLQSICLGLGSLGGWGILATGSLIIAAMTGQTVFDCLGSVAGVFRDVTIIGDSTLRPAVGIQVGRINLTAHAAGGHVFDNVRMVGFFTTAGILNASGEGNTYLNLSIQNDDSSGTSYCLAIDGLHHIVPVTIFTQTTRPQNSSDSCRQHEIINCNLLKTAGGSPLFLSNVNQLSITGYLYATGTDAIQFLAGAGQTVFSNLAFLAHCEANITNQLNVTALSVQTVTFEGMKFREDASTATVSMIAGTTNVSALRLTGADIWLGSNVPVPLLGGSAAFYDLFTPVVTASTGAITTVGIVSGYQKKVGQLVTVQFNVIITTNGTGAGQINIAGLVLPSATAAYGAGKCLTNNKMLQVAISSLNSTLVVLNYDGTYPAGNGFQLVGSITYTVNA